MGRFLIFFSYIGTHYRGLQIQRQAGEVITRFKTVQAVLEEHLRKLNPTNEIVVKTSSRTDSNVHAFCNTCHVDLAHKYQPREFNPNWITMALNTSFRKANERMLVQKTLRVPDDFSCRFEASGRSYVYRLAVVNQSRLTAFRREQPWVMHDFEYTAKVYQPFDLDLFLRAAEMLSGTHCFLSFSVKSSFKSKRPTDQRTNLTIHVRRGSGWLAGNHNHEYKTDVIDFWEVHFHGWSFLYKQVRRMMGAMVSVAEGRMSLQQLQYFLDHPNPCVKASESFSTMPGHALTLKTVHYPDYVYSYNFHHKPEVSLNDSESHQQPADIGDVIIETLPYYKKLRLIETLPPAHWSSASMALASEYQERLQNSSPTHKNLGAQDILSSEIRERGHCRFDEEKCETQYSEQNFKRMAMKNESRLEDQNSNT